MGLEMRTPEAISHYIDGATFGAGVGGEQDYVIMPQVT